MNIPTDSWFPEPPAHTNVIFYANETVSMPNPLCEVRAPSICTTSAIAMPLYEQYPNPLLSLLKTRCLKCWSYRR